MAADTTARKHAEALKLAKLLVQQAHQLPIDLSLAFEPANAARTCARIEKLSGAIRQLLADIAAAPQELDG